MLNLPVIHGVIRRRLLVNYRVDPEIIATNLPAGFRPKLKDGHAIAGICLIRLEDIRPRGWPAWTGISSENAAHRIAVTWNDDQGGEEEGVYIPRRDTNSLPNHLAGGRVFPGEHHFANFQIRDEAGHVDLSIRSRDGRMTIRVDGRESDGLPESSVFASLADSSAFFENGSIGYSATRDCCRLDGIRLETHDWTVKPFAVDRVETSFFDNPASFPAGSAEFDHALIMRDIPHHWIGIEGKSLAIPA